MAATVASERRDSVGGGRSLPSSMMDRGYRAQGRSRSPRFHTDLAATSVDEEVKMEETQQKSSPTQPSPHRPVAVGEESYMQEWHYPRNTTALKRRASQRSPSRPRSQQGSQIDTVKEADAELEKEERNKHAGQHPVPAEETEAASFSHDPMPRKTARLTHQHHRKGLSSGEASGSEGRGHVDWALKPSSAVAGVPRMSDSEITSASSSRLQVSHSRTPSNEELMNETRSLGRQGGDRGDRMHARLEEIEAEPGSNYTWRAEREEPTTERGEEEADVKSDGSPANSSHRLPSLASGFRSAPSASSGGPASYTRNSSPSPRLPGFSSLHAPAGAYPPHGQRPDERAASPPSSSRHTHQGPYGGATYTSPRTGMGHSSAALKSPALSQTSSQAPPVAPGQAFIHPSLAGLPGAGGVAGSKQQPSFVSKLYSMLEDETIADMISWGPSGTVFSVANPAEFSKVVLPNWFKHSNWQSFVRQLNMYGFHKVNHTYQGTPDEEIQVWEFKHPSFRRGEVQMLNDIKRKSSRHKRQGSLGRSLNNMGDFDVMGGRSPGSRSPSPDMGMSHLGPAARSNMPAPMHYRQHSSRSMTGGLGHAPPREYGHGATSSAAIGAGMAGHSRHHHGGSSSSLHYPAPGEALRHEAQVVGVMGSESTTARMDDLSDRIDAIIRHASYLESQLRSVSDQLYQSQQNEVSLSRHVQHLELQVKGLEEHLQLRSVPIAARHGSPPPILPHHPSGMPSPAARAGSRAPTTAYPARSPIVAHPSYSSSYTRGSAPTHSSADAYQKLPPPPPGPSSRRDRPPSPLDGSSSSEKRFRG